MSKAEQMFVRKSFGAIAIIVAATIVVWGNYHEAKSKEVRIAAAAKKSEVSTEIDAADTFARISVSKDWEIISWNHGATKMFGWKSKEIVGTQFGEIWPKGLAMRFGEFRINDKQKWEASGTIVIKTKDGSNLRCDAMLVEVPSARIAYLIPAKLTTPFDVFNSRLMMHLK